MLTFAKENVCTGESSGPLLYALTLIQNLLVIDVGVWEYGRCSYADVARYATEKVESQLVMEFYLSP